jgi:hypothetical protein
VRHFRGVRHSVVGNVKTSIITQTDEVDSYKGHAMKVFFSACLIMHVPLVD